MESIILKLLAAFTAGALFFVLISFTVYRKSYYYKKARAEAGAGETPDRKSLLVTLAIMLVMVLSLVGFDLWVLTDEGIGFLRLLIINLGLVSALSLFDALVIDWLLLLVWRPTFLQLPAGQPTQEYMARHIRVQFTKGWIFKIPISVLGAGAAWLIKTVLS